MPGSNPCAPDCLCGRHFAKKAKCKPGCTCKKHSNGPWTGDSASEQAKHKRLHKARGSARQHNCIDCGRSACDWSRRHDRDGLDPSDYDPRCRKCHHNYDAHQHPHGMMGDFIVATS